MASFFDTFPTDGTSLGGNWTVHAGDYHVVSGAATGQSSYAFDAAIYSAQALGGDQYAHFKMPATGDWLGALFRYTNTSSKLYIVTYNLETWYWNTWLTIGNASYNTITSSSLSMSSGDTVGITVRGIGTDTEVRIWKNPTNKTPYSMTAWDSVSDTTPDITWTTDPGTDAVDSGSYAGFYSYGASGKAIDDFYAGDYSSTAIEQEGFRPRNDDGTEATATWKANQDTNITLAADTAFRLRMLLNATGDPDSINAQLEYRYKPTGGAFGSWTKVN